MWYLREGAGHASYLRRHHGRVPLLPRERSREEAQRLARTGWALQEGVLLPVP